MRKLTVIMLLAVLAAIGWGLFWLIGATAMEKALAQWLDDRRAEGWRAETTALETRGFPSRFDTTFEGLDLADPDTGVAWSAPLFQLLSLSYKPTQVIAVFPGVQRFSTPEAAYEIEAERMRGSMSLAPSLSLETRNSTIEIDMARLTSSQDWVATLERAQLSMRQSPDSQDPGMNDVFITARGIDPGSAVFTRLDGITGLGQLIDEVTLTARVRFDRPWDRRAIEVARPQPRAVEIEALTARWGDLLLTGAGAVEVGPEGEPRGEIELEATNWREMLAIAEAGEAISAQEADRIERGLTLLAGLGGDPDRLDVTLRFERGLTFLGPVPVGPAPDFSLP
ncbi:DUF2125 domain-containing protein [Sinisalibacter lacisalsi]|uniref:DUF2125 domain-containing protein n=1 Tax=Sinisalibacter lacisalsi TaxID=1526570 RepID=A0ABQ1QN31_9RHOB|nr:DUF2125 domain-containing protein [Sinisalibacter lacisalsi]GGD35767.1 hypothetical protein GCM10011358_19500 [Sinisalibacter lacisalsi]